MIGYFLYLDHIIKIDVDDYYLRPMRNPQTATYLSKNFKILEIKTLDNKIIKELGEYIFLKFYKKNILYVLSEEQIRYTLKKENGLQKYYYESGNVKEKYFVNNGKIVEDTHRFYDDV
jgi:antitoxin component YwqK of YwqJK toxin-antitoxin module